MPRRDFVDAPAIVIGARRTAARIVVGASGALRSPSYSFGAMSPSEHDSLLAVLRAALLSGGTDGSVAMSAPGAGDDGGGLDSLQGGQSVADALAQEARERALLQRVAQTTTAQILQKSAAARALGL